MSRHFWAMEFPVGNPLRGPAFGERTDPGAIGMNVPAGQGPAAAMSGVGTLLNVFGNFAAGSAAARAGKDARAAAEFEAAQLDQAAGQGIASAQRKAIEERRRAALVASRQLAVAAASGGGASDPTITNLIADVEGEGAYRAAVALYEGDERGRQLRLGADAKRYEGELMERGGKDRQMAYTLRGIGAGVTGYAGLYGKYGQGGPKKYTPSSGGGAWLDGPGGDSGNDLYG